MTNKKNEITKKDMISIIIVNYKSEKPLISCLKKIYDDTNSRKKIEVIIVNNGTGSNKLMKEISNLSQIKLIHASANIGFAAGVNLGMGVARNNLILLLNPDTLVSIRSIEVLKHCLRKNNAGIVGGANYKFNGERHNTYVRRPNLFTYLFDYTNLRKLTLNDYFHKRHYYLDQPFSKNKIEVDAVSGSFMLIDKKVIKKIGGLDERYFMYLEDIDYCIRAKDAGFKILFCPKSVIKHVGGYSSKNKERVHIKAWLDSRRHYVLKHENILTNILVQLVFLIDSIVIKILQKYK